jgi:gas vesicle protein
MSQENQEVQVNTEVEQKAKRSKGWIWGAALGTVVGSVTALLLAPKAGKEVRKDIAVGARKAGEKTTEVAHKVGEQTVEIAGKVKNTADGLVQDFQNWRSGKNGEAPVVTVSSDSTEAVEPVMLGIADEAAPTAEEVVVVETEEQTKEEK